MNCVSFSVALYLKWVSQLSTFSHSKVDKFFRSIIAASCTLLFESISTTPTGVAGYIVYACLAWHCVKTALPF